MATTKFFFIDDSGTVDAGWIVYAVLEVDITAWSRALGSLLDFRKGLDRTDGIPTARELHATEFLRGAGNPSRHPGWNRRKAHRSRVALAALHTIASLPGTHLAAVYRRTTTTGPAYHAQRADLYGCLVHNLDHRLAADGDHGIVVMDGNGTDRSYRRQHRTLDLTTRRIVEDPFPAGSDTSQLIQATDLLAYTAYQHLARLPARQFMWDWWPDHLPHAAPPTAM